MSKFLSYEDRLIIAKGLQENASFGEIAKEFGKDRTNITKKICGNACSHQSAYQCSLCSECILHCPDFEENVCSVKNKAITIFHQTGMDSQNTKIFKF